MTLDKWDVLFETINYCNLHCPACPWHSTMTREKVMLQPDDFRKIFEHISPYARSICFYVMGEPLLNNNIFEYISTAHKAGIHTGISTNGMLLDQYINDVFTSGLDFIQIALDGMDAKTHESYRVGADFNKVMSNLKKLVQEKQLRDSTCPEIQIQTLISRQNENRLDEFKAFADNLGVSFSAKKMMFGKTEEIIRKNRKIFEPEQQKYRRLDNPNLIYFNEMDTCPQLKCITILCNGDVVPCCYDYDGEVIWGNLIKQTWPEVMDGKPRITFLEKRKLGQSDLCKTCDMSIEKNK